MLKVITKLEIVFDIDLANQIRLLVSKYPEKKLGVFFRLGVFHKYQ